MRVAALVAGTERLARGAHLDGSQHAQAEASASDAARTAKLKALGWNILRFWNDDVIRDIDNVCRHVVIEAGLAAAEMPVGEPAREFVS